MQLQRRIDELRDRDIELFAVSYDTPEEHRRFADEFGISYHLLSDADSATIKRFGILNTLIEPDNPIRTSGGRSFHGIPFPGVYIVDRDGIVREKYFNRSYTTRNSAGTVLNSALGAVLRPEAAPEQSWQGERIGFRAFLSDPVLRLEYASTLYVRFELADGFHIYSEPLPDGFIPTTVEVTEVHGLTLGDPVYPATRSKAFPELGVTLPVYEGIVDIAMPVTANAKILNWMLREKPERIDVPVRVNHQVCSDSVCYPPLAETLTLTVPLGPLQL